MTYSLSQVVANAAMAFVLGGFVSAALSDLLFKPKVVEKPIDELVREFERGITKHSRSVMRSAEACTPGTAARAGREMAQKFNEAISSN